MASTNLTGVSPGMSASPADPTPTPGRTPNGGIAPKMRRPKNVDPLVRPKKKQMPRPQRPPTMNGITQPQQLPNGHQIPGITHSEPISQPPRGMAPLPSQPKMANPSQTVTSGFFPPPQAPYTDFPLVLTKRALMEGYRHHIARFSGKKKKIDPRNPDEFVRPVRLHRRDPRGAQNGGNGLKVEGQSSGATNDLDEKERERQEILKAERDAKREAELALIAPATSSNVQRKPGQNMKKTEQVYRNDQTEEQKAQSKLRYEEALPWHLEDFDGKNIWVGSYEAAMSDTYAMMIHSRDGLFRLVPLEKWYRFTQKGKFKTLTSEQAEDHFKKKIKEPRWFMDSEAARLKRQEEEQAKKASSGLYLGKLERGGGGSGSAAPFTKHEDPDVDDIDFQEDRFADDEENVGLFEEDDETKEAEKRIQKDQLQANVFDLKEEKEYEKQELLEKREKENEKKQGKGVKKALMKREKNYIYDSDSTDNPYTSESESESTETERLKEEERKKAEETKGTTDKDKQKVKNSSGQSGNNTPSHRPSKHGRPLKNAGSTGNLKRAGSPLNSEASGNESTRKKLKKQHPLASAQVQAQTKNSTLKPPSRPTSPPIPPPSSSAPNVPLRKPSNVPAKRPRGAGSGSDSDRVAGSGGEMSDGTRKRIKLKLGPPSKSGSPQGSRAGSPEAPNANTVASTAPAAKAGADRAKSSAPSPPIQSRPFPTPSELRARIPPEGITVKELLNDFRGQIVGRERQDRFMALMKANSRYAAGDKKLMPL